MAKRQQRQEAPDPARVYERAKPEAEAGIGRLDNNDGATPTRRPDQMGDAVTHAQKARQINAHDVVDERAGRVPGGEGKARSK
jgi:hypothetical protein